MQKEANGSTLSDTRLIPVAKFINALHHFPSSSKTLVKFVLHIYNPGFTKISSYVLYPQFSAVFAFYPDCEHPHKASPLAYVMLLLAYSPPSCQSSWINVTIFYWSPIIFAEFVYCRLTLMNAVQTFKL